MKAYKLDPKIWDRGRSGDKSVSAGKPVLLDGPTGRCCLGFVAVDEGLPINGADSPMGCRRLRLAVSGWLNLGLLTNGDYPPKHSALAVTLMGINDKPDTGDRDRVDQLNSALETHGADWRFELQG